jgi:hypothetical protein
MPPHETNVYRIKLEKLKKNKKFKKPLLSFLVDNLLFIMFFSSYLCIRERNEVVKEFAV